MTIATINQHQIGSGLCATEREVVLTIADDEQTWTLYCDSTRFRGRLLKFCQRLGVTPEEVGVGFEAHLPLKAVRFSTPRQGRQLSEEERGKAVERGKVLGRLRRSRAAL